MENEICHLKLEKIIPKNNIPHDKINEYLHDNFIQSIKKHGIIQPIVVKKSNDKYEIIDGNRRYFAALKVGLDKIPSLVRHDRENAIKLELRDNIDDSNLSPIEEAKKYREILDTSSITQEQLAKNLGKSQSALANKLRLLNLPIEIQDSLNNFEISERHARSLLSVKNENVQLELLKKIKTEKLTVRELDSEIKNMSNMFIPEEFSNKNNNSQNNNQGNMLNSIDNGQYNQSNNMFIPNSNDSLGNNPSSFVQNNNFESDSSNVNNNSMNQFILPDNNGGMNPFFTNNNYAAPSSNNMVSNNNDNTEIPNFNQSNPFSSIRMNTNNLNNNQPINNFNNNNDNNSFDINDYKLPEYENNGSNNMNNFQSTPSSMPFEPTSIEPTTEYKYVEDNPNYVSVDNPKGVSSVDDVIEILKGSLEKIKNGKIKVDTEEIDYDDTYQITIRIDKKGDFL